jgi:ABC-type Fe3+/spermidine/putrescine transport system ATPase subunit
VHRDILILLAGQQSVYARFIYHRAMAAVTVRDLVVHYDTTTVLDRVSVSVASGELLMLLGPSGCGKTTLLRSIAGFVEPRAGAILFDDEEVTRRPAHARGVGMVFQSFALWPHMTVAENVGFGLRERRVPAAEIARRVEEALESTRMGGTGKRPIDQLSGGEQQRVALARALVIRPRCLLLDEPLSNLDAKLRQSMRDEIRRLCKSAGLTTIYVTHDQKEALAIADRIAVMQKGRILQIGAPAEIYRRPQSRAVATFIGETNLFQARVAGADAGGIRVDSALGAFVAAPDQTFAPAPGSEVWVSIRPECLRATASPVSPNVLRGQLRDDGSLYLGEIAERRVRVGDVSLTSYELNPTAAAIAAAEATFEVAPADVVLLPVDSMPPTAPPGGGT